MAVLDEQREPLDDPEFELVLLRAREVGAKTTARRQLEGLAPAVVIAGTFVLSVLAVVLGVP